MTPLKRARAIHQTWAARIIRLPRTARRDGRVKVEAVTSADRETVMCGHSASAVTPAFLATAVPISLRILIEVPFPSTVQEHPFFSTDLSRPAFAMKG
jgi:hypothetical protein